MRIKEGHEGRKLCYTHQCSYPLPAGEELRPDILGNDNPFCGTLIKSGWNKVHKLWISTKSSEHMKIHHPGSVSGSVVVKRQRVCEDKKEDQMFQAGMNKYVLSPVLTELTSAGRFMCTGGSAFQRRPSTKNTSRKHCVGVTVLVPC